MHVSNQQARKPDGGPRRTQAGRTARTRSALLESAARGLSRYGYGNLVLEGVARDAGYSRGALYHQFADKEDLTLAVIDWAFATWKEEVGFARVVTEEGDPVRALMTLARGHAVYCRRDVARLVMALRLEFSGQDHPVGLKVERVYDAIVDGCARPISVARKSGLIPPRPGVRTLALALVGAVEGAVIQLAGRTPDDELLAVRAAAGVLGLDPGALPAPLTVPSS